MEYVGPVLVREPALVKVCVEKVYNPDAMRT
jgi:hypothetical protein